MKRNILLILILVIISSFAFSNEFTSVKSNSTSYFKIPAWNKINLPDQPSMDKYSFSFSNTADKLLFAAIMFTAFDGLNLLLGITGAILYGVSTGVLFTSSDVTGVLLYGGIALMAWGFTWFGLLLAGVITFWVLYLVNNGSAMKKIKVSDQDIAICIRL